MFKIDEEDPIGELDPSFPFRDVSVRRNVDVKEYYNLEEEIGRGKFGTVYRCREKSTGFTLAAKFVGIARRQDRKNVEREVEIMRNLQHPRLIQLYDAFESANVMCVVLELIEGGELFERVIDDDFILTEKACTVFMRQICEGVEFIHSKNIIHLDLKPENILCLTKTGNRIKIIDFGLARKHEPDKKLQVLFGTPEFVAPEVVNFDQISFSTDMWSVGVICYVLLSGLSPFMGETDIQTMANVTVAQYDFDDEAFDEISDVAKDFISKLLVKNQEARLTASECLTHLWLRRKLPPPPPSLDATKDNLKNFVDRYITNQPGVPAVESTISEKPSARIIKDLIEHPTPIVELNLSQIKKHNLSDDLQNGTVNNEFRLQQRNLYSPVLMEANKTENMDKVGNKSPAEKHPLFSEPEAQPHENMHLTMFKEYDPNTEIIQSKPRSQNFGHICTFVNVPDITLSNEDAPIEVPIHENELRGVGNKIMGWSVVENQKPSKSLGWVTLQLPKQDPKDTVDNCRPSKSSTTSVPLPGTSKIEMESEGDDLMKMVELSGFSENVGPISINFESKFKEELALEKYFKSYAPRMKDVKPNKCLNTNPNPKIHGIVLGQMQNDEKKDSAERQLYLLPNIGFEAPSAKKIIEENEIPKRSKQANTFTSKEKSTEVSTTSNRMLRTTAPWFSESFHTFEGPLMSAEKFDRRASDISCYLHDEEDSDGVNLAEEIKKLSVRLFQMSNKRDMTEDDAHNNNNNNIRRDSLPSVSQKRDPISQFLASHGVHPTRRPKFKFSNLNRDVPIGSPPPASNITYYMAHNFSQSTARKDSMAENASGSKETSIFQRLHETKEKCSHLSQEKSSIESLASYFKKSKTETKQAMSYYLNK